MLELDDVLDVLERDGFWTLHGPDGHAVHLPDPTPGRAGKAVVPVFDTPASAVGVLLHIAESGRRHASEIGLARWDGTDLNCVLSLAVRGDRAVALVHDVDQRVMVAPDDPVLLGMLLAGGDGPDDARGSVERWFDLDSLSWTEASVH